MNADNSWPQEMQAIEITAPGGPEVLQLTKRPTPAPRPNEVLIRVEAAGVNRPDVLQRMGLYPPPPGASDLPGLEVSGEIVAKGSEAIGWRVDDKVCALLPSGGYAEYAAVDAGSCLPVPEGLTLEQAAVLPETCFTVWANVFEDGQLKAGETLLVHGATSGIGATAISLAKACGARVVTTVGSDEKIKAAESLGADAVFNYQSDEWDKGISALGGADVVLDITGGDFVARNIQCLNPGGRHVSIAFLRGAEATVNIFAIMQKRLRLSGSTMKARSLVEKARLAGEIRRHVWPLLAAGKARIPLDRTFPLAEAAAAHKFLESGGHLGKIVLKTR